MDETTASASRRGPREACNGRWSGPLRLFHRCDKLARACPRNTGWTPAVGRRRRRLSKETVSGGGSGTPFGTPGRFWRSWCWQPLSSSRDAVAAKNKPSHPRAVVAAREGREHGPGGGTADGSTVKSKASAETSKDTPFTLNLQQPVPPDFRAAYQRKALIVVEFLKEHPDPTQGINYPQGIGADDRVDQSLKDLRTKYPQIEFFTYDIDKPGNATTSEDLGGAITGRSPPS